MPILCSNCIDKRAVLKRPKTGHSLCKECFFWAFEEEVHQTIVAAKLFKHGEIVGIAASGGKDSTVLAHLMKLLNERYNYGLELMLLSVDEGISGYRDDSLETVKRNQQQYELPLKIVSYEELYGWTMDAIVKQVGLKNNCTFCGVFRRQALDRGAIMLKVDKICTGHNADDVAETVLMNVLRGDIARLRRCTAISTASEGENLSVREGVKMPVQGTCNQCGYISSQALCKSCVLLEGLNRGLPKLGIGKHHRLHDKILSKQPLTEKEERKLKAVHF
ncbi:cytoplasmic tRNA 2-thiolation protein 1 isoform X2 [Cyclopterus lumpus]|uniref:cytoplasmic tRNA 2-thiolation protein 1 isoform X2 n=1 Tax=Cyclopterus lumpus TaxID=8103 RepID=UPI001486249C|nr:cytoplasmic tRNA 2-thiolation protein 1 isoform X2 [Cyclopterus lumpus]